MIGRLLNRWRCVRSLPVDSRSFAAASRIVAALVLRFRAPSCQRRLETGKADSVADSEEALEEAAVSQTSRCPSPLRRLLGLAPSAHAVTQSLTGKIMFVLDRRSGFARWLIYSARGEMTRLGQNGRRLNQSLSGSCARQDAESETTPMNSCGPTDTSIGA